MTTSTTVLLPPVRPVARPVEGPPRWRRRRRPDGRRRTVRVVVRAVVAVLLLTLAMAGWIGVRAAMAVSTLAAAEPALRDVTSAFEGGDRDTVLHSADEVRAAVGRVRDLVDEPVWRTAEHLPVVGPRLHTVRAAAQAADALARDALGPAVALADTVSFGPYGQDEGFAELVQATELRTDLDAIAQAVVQARAAVDGVTTDLFVPQLSEPFAQGIDTLEQVADLAVGLGPGLDLLLDITGYPETAVTAIVVLDDRAHRPLGGRIERVYLLSAERGLVQDFNALDLAAVREAAVESPAFTAAAAGPQAALLTTPDVTQLAVTADAGAALAEGIAAVEGVTPQAVVLVTPEGLDAVHAPAREDGDGEPLAAQLAAAPGDERDDVMDEAVRDIVGAVLTLRAAADTTALAVSDAVVAGELRVWSADRELQDELAATRGGGGLPAGSTLAVAVSADTAGAPSRLAPVRLTTATGECGALWTRRSEVVLAVEMAEVAEAGEGAVPSRLLVALPRGAAVLGVESPGGAVPHEVVDLGGQQLLTVTPSSAGEVALRLAGGTPSLDGVGVVARGGIPAPEAGTFSCG